MAVNFNCQKFTKILIFLFSFTLSTQICINKECKILISANFLPLIMAIQLDEILWNEPVTVFLAAVQFVARCYSDNVIPMHFFVSVGIARCTVTPGTFSSRAPTIQILDQGQHLFFCRKSEFNFESEIYPVEKNPKSWYYSPRRTLYDNKIYLPFQIFSDRD